MAGSTLGTGGSGRRTKTTKKSGARKTAARKSAASSDASTKPNDGANGQSNEPVSMTQVELLPEGKLYYRIGEVAKITGVKPHVLRYWETEFRWMAPPKSRSKQRLYRRKDIEMILVIKRLLYEERYTIAGARQQLRELGLSKALESGPVATAAAQAAAHSPIDDLRTGYRRVRSELAGIRALL
jgi:DNA-binding transcriptional MerR regulator